MVARFNVEELRFGQLESVCLAKMVGQGCKDVSYWMTPFPPVRPAPAPPERLGPGRLSLPLTIEISKLARLAGSESRLAARSRTQSISSRALAPPDQPPRQVFRFCSQRRFA